MPEQIIFVLAVAAIVVAALLITKLDPAFKKPWVMNAFDPKWNEDDA